MSYCRFGYNSDVYCYKSCYGGWQVHVATHRHVSDIPFPDDARGWRRADPFEVREAHRAQMAWYKDAKIEPINIVPKGVDANLDTPREAADYLEHLRSLGYTVPQFAIDSLREEAISRENTPR